MDNLTDSSGPVYSSVILPSTVIKLIAKSDIQFRMRLAPSKHEIQQFWERLFSSPEGMAYKELHPILRHMTTAQLATRFPIRVHEDAGPYTKNCSCNIICWSSLFGRGSEKEVKYHVIFRTTYLCYNRQSDHLVTAQSLAPSCPGSRSPAPPSTNTHPQTSFIRPMIIRHGVRS